MSTADTPWSTEQVAALFNPMEREYDDIQDIWYSWLFSRLHALLFEETQSRFGAPGARCLDVGCGTGLQTLLLALMGHSACGVDIADKLVRVAVGKSVTDFDKAPLFPGAYAFARRYQRALHRQVNRYRDGDPIGRTQFAIGDAAALPQASESIDIVNCCGSTLNFVQHYPVALAEMSRVLRPGGMLFLEVENRFSPDLLWALVDSCIGGALGFDQSLRESWMNLTAPSNAHVRIDYPFSSGSETVYMPMTLFSLRQFCRELEGQRFKVDRIHAIHAVTNLLPSTILDSPNPPSWLRATASALVAIESVAGSWPIVRRLGCSAVVVCTRV